MHSHAVAPESSGAFFLDMGTERCMFQAGVLRNALRASQAVHATDVMVNRVGGLALRPSVTDHLICKTWNFQRSIVLP